MGLHAFFSCSCHLLVVPYGYLVKRKFLVIRTFYTEARWFWVGLFLLAAEKLTPRHEPKSLDVVNKIRQALDAMPTD